MPMQTGGHTHEHPDRELFDVSGIHHWPTWMSDETGLDVSGIHYWPTWMSDGNIQSAPGPMLTLAVTHDN